MGNSEEQAFIEIVEHMDNQGKAYSDWYCGIASNPRERLFNEHHVDERNGLWIYSPCSSDTAARDVEAKLINLGCNGGCGGGDETTIYVYAYLKTCQTNP